MPRRLGTGLFLSARYDNSAGNPRNPNNPPKAVGWGENTTDEMCIGFVSFTLDAENLTRLARRQSRARGRSSPPPSPSCRTSGPDSTPQSIERAERVNHELTSDPSTM